MNLRRDPLAHMVDLSRVDDPAAKEHLLHALTGHFQIEQVAIATSGPGQSLLKELNGEGNIVLARVKPAIHALYEAFWREGAARAIRQQLASIVSDISTRRTLAMLVQLSQESPYVRQIRLPDGRQVEVVLSANRDSVSLEAAIMPQAARFAVAPEAIIAALAAEGLAELDEGKKAAMENLYAAQERDLAYEANNKQLWLLGLLFPKLPAETLETPATPTVVQGWLETALAEHADRDFAKQVMRDRWLPLFGEEAVSLPIDDTRVFLLRVSEEPLLDALRLSPSQQAISTYERYLKRH